MTFLERTICHHPNSIQMFLKSCRTKAEEIFKLYKGILARKKTNNKQPDCKIPWFFSDLHRVACLVELAEKDIYGTSRGGVRGGRDLCAL